MTTTPPTPSGSCSQSDIDASTYLPPCAPAPKQREPIRSKRRTFALACAGAVLATSGCQPPPAHAVREVTPSPTRLSASGAGSSWPSLFSWQPWSTFNGQRVTQGDVGCVAKGGTVNPQWTSWTTQSPNSLAVSNALSECHTINTANTCMFNVGAGGVTGFSFSYNLTKSCVTASGGGAGTTWLAFWIYTQQVPNQWQSTAEVDAIESKFGPSSGLNMNFSGNPTQAAIPLSAVYNGSISATFSGSGTSVHATIRETTTNTSAAEVSPLSQNQGYFFVLDTANYPSDGSVAGCTVTITNLQITGTVPAGQCAGIPITPAAK